MVCDWAAHLIETLPHGQASTSLAHAARRAHRLSAWCTAAKSVCPSSPYVAVSGASWNRLLHSIFLLTKYLSAHILIGHQWRNNRSHKALVWHLRSPYFQKGLGALSIYLLVQLEKHVRVVWLFAHSINSTTLGTGYHIENIRKEKHS